MTEDPREAHSEADEQFLMDLTDPQVRRLQEVHHRALDARDIAIYQFPQDPLPNDAHEMWIRSHDATDWKLLGYITDPVIGIDYGAEDPSASAVLAWPYKHGKSAFTVSLEASFTYTRSRFDEAVHVFDALYRARLDRRLARLARALGQWEETVRRDFHAVQRVLEDAGVLDGYGRLTIPQPVRPPAIWGTP